LLALLAVAFCQAENLEIDNNLPEMSAEMIDFINSVQDTWVAGKNDRFYEKDPSMFAMGLGHIFQHKNQLEKLDTKHLINKHTVLPESFDSREKWAQCESIKTVRDQSNCGSCWAVSAASVMSDRLCIASKQVLQTMISSEDLLSCCKDCGYGCRGGFPPNAWRYFRDSGIVSGGEYHDNRFCKPYAFPPCEHKRQHLANDTYSPCSSKLRPTPVCVRECQKGVPETYKHDRHYADFVYTLEPKEEQIMLDIFHYGPVQAAFRVYSDFGLYKSGVYFHVSGKYSGGHAVKIIGWGKEKNVPYWLVANSWNEDWGEKGLFKIRRGNNECGIESEITAGYVKV